MKPIMIFLYIIFIVSIFTGLGDLIGGAASIPGATATIAASIDNELRCLSVFWIAFGGFCFWVARDIPSRNHFIPMIAFVMLISGCARLLSLVKSGMPAIILCAAMIIEIVISVILYMTYKKSNVKQLRYAEQH